MGRLYSSFTLRWREEAWAGVVRNMKDSTKSTRPCAKATSIERHIQQACLGFGVGPAESSPGHTLRHLEEEWRTISGDGKGLRYCVSDSEAQGSEGQGPTVRGTVDRLVEDLYDLATLIPSRLPRRRKSSTMSTRSCGKARIPVQTKFLESNIHSDNIKVQYHRDYKIST